MSDYAGDGDPADGERGDPDPCGSCDECGTNIYPDDFYADEHLCDMCGWMIYEAD